MSPAEEKVFAAYGMEMAWVKCFKDIKDADALVAKLSTDEFVTDAFVVKTFASGCWYVVVVPFAIEVHGA